MFPATFLLSGLDKGWFSKRVVLADVPPEREPERGYIQVFPPNENRNEGAFGCFPGTKTGTRVHSLKPPSHETGLLSPNDSYCLENRKGTPQATSTPNTFSKMPCPDALSVRKRRWKPGIQGKC